MEKLDVDETFRLSALTSRQLEMEYGTYNEIQHTHTLTVEKLKPDTSWHVGLFSEEASPVSTQSQ